MAISLSGFASGQDAFANDIDVTLTIASDDDYIVAMVGSNTSAGDAVASVTLDPGGANEAAFTKAVSDFNDAQDDVEATIWYLPGTDIPSAGDYTVRFSFASDASQAAGGVQAMSGAAQQAPEATVGSGGSQGGSSWSVTVPGTTSGAVIFDCGMARDAETETDDEAQKLFGLEPGGAIDVFGSHESSTGGDVTASWSFGNTAPGILVGASVAAASTSTSVSSTTTVPYEALLRDAMAESAAYEGLGGVFGSTTLPYEAIGLVTAPRAVAYEVREALVARSRTVPYEAIGGGRLKAAEDVHYEVFEPFILDVVEFRLRVQRAIEFTLER